MSDQTGHYQVLALPPGEYEVNVALTGFRSVAHRGIRLTVGQTAVIDSALELGVVSEMIEVRGDAVSVNLATGAVSGLVGEREIRDLPLNGRSFQQLALMQPGVQAALAAGNDVVGGRTPKISINGARPEMNSFLLDGTDINNVYNKTPGSAAGVLLGVEAVLEFQVLTNAYSAEFGRSAGGVFNAVTRSGANRYTGSVFEFHRNSALDARNFFDPESLPKPEFTRHQFGGVLGGPLQRDRTFFFGAYEGLVERLGVTGVTAVPDDDARRGIIGGRQVGLHPAVPRYLDVLFPRANGRSLGNGGAEYLFTESQPTDEHLYQLRIDHQTSAANNLFVRVTHDRAEVIRIPPNKPPIATIDEATRNTYVTGQYQHSFTQNTLNQLRLGLNRSVSLADNRRTIDIPPDLAWLPGEKFGYLTIQGLVTEMAGDFRLPRNDRLNNWQISDMLIATRGRHLLRLGAQAQYLQFDQDTTSQAGGIVTFNSLELFLTGRPSNVDFAVPGKIDPDPQVPAMAVRRVHARRRAADRPAVAESGAALRGRDGAHRSRRQDLQPAQRHRCRAHDWRPVARQPVAEEFRPARGRGVGSGGLGPDLGAGRLRHLSRSDPAQVLLLLRQPQPAVHDADVDRQPAVPERDCELRYGCLHSRPTADGERRPADAVHHAVQRQRATRDHCRPRRDGGIRRLARPQPASAGRRQPRAGNHGQWRQDLSAGGRAPEPQFHRRVAADDRRAVVLRLAPGLGEPPLLPRLAGAAVVHAVGIHRRCERDQLTGFQQQRAVRV